MTMPGRNYNAGSGYRYGFNGKELDKEVASTTTYDYGFRIYSPALGKFLSVDPLTKEFPWYSPYHFAGSNPIYNVDLDGLEEWSYIQTLKKQWKGGTAIELYDEKQSGYKVILTICMAAICADGSPNAYNSKNTGIDDNANGGITNDMIKDNDFRIKNKKGEKTSETAYGIVVDEKTYKAPIQDTKSSDGADKFVSPTSMRTSATGSLNAQTTYVNSEEINYIVLPRDFQKYLPKGVKVKFGDVVQVFNKETGLSANAIYAENGPKTQIGEISIALAKALGIKNTSPKDGGTESKILQIAIYLGSGSGNGDSGSKSQAAVDAKAKAITDKQTPMPDPCAGQ